MYSFKLLNILSLILFILLLSAIATPISLTGGLDEILEERAAAQSSGLNCKDISVTVDINYPQLQLPASTSANSLLSLTGGLINFSFTKIVSGRYTIAGTYCEPEVDVPSRRNTLQILAHPATYDRQYWFGGNHTGFNSSQYSWVSYASKLGYPTFAYDRLGNGLSQHPDPILEVQCSAQAATIHQIILLARYGSTTATASPFPRTFNNIITVGCSMGSLVNNILHANYPDDVNATIQTGFSKRWFTVIPGFTLTAGLIPAALEEPARYGSLHPGYLEASNPSGAQYLLYYGPGQYFDPAFIAADYAARGTITLGEALSGAFPPNAPNYKGSVLVITGDQDVVFCGFLGLVGMGAGNCLFPENILAETESLYPAAKDYAYFALPNSGHCWEHQYTAQTGFAYAHNWLSGKGY